MSKVSQISYSCVASLVLLGCPVGEKSAKTVDGPETIDLVDRITGHLVIAEGGAGIIAVALPSMERTTVRSMPKDQDGLGPIVHALSGPDNERRVAYIEDHFFVKDEKDEQHQLKTIRIDGTDDTMIFSRPGSAMWATSAAGHGEIGTYLALAPSGGHVAFLSAVKDRQMPGALLNTGTIEIWDVVRKTPLQIDTRALDEPMSWFPDGERLAYVALVQRDKLPESLPGLEEFGGYGPQTWDEVPAVHVLDVKSGESTLLHVGWTPVVSYDGKRMLVGGWNGQMEFNWMDMDLEQGQSLRVRWSGDARGAIAYPGEKLVLYWGLPTTGSPISWTANNSPLSGPKLMLTIKAAVIDSNEFQTVVPAIDPRSRVSFGRSE